MRCPTLAELPPAADAKAGWPWTVESPQAPALMSSGRAWPRISIIMPSLNQGLYIEEAIRSVLLQGYPDLEFIVNDGGSEDNTVEIIEKYKYWLASWQSLPDGGQSRSINLGIKDSTGDIIAYLNSDDYYRPGTFYKVATVVAMQGALWVTGSAHYVGVDGAFLSHIEPTVSWTIDDVIMNAICSPIIHSAQVSNFYHRNVFESFGLFREDFHLTMDAEFNLRLIFSGLRPWIVGGHLASARLHGRSKTMLQGRKGGFELGNMMALESQLQSAPAQLHPKLHSALRAYRRLQTASEVLGSFREDGLGSGVLKAASAIIQDPQIALHRPLWGAVRQGIFQ